MPTQQSCVRSMSLAVVCQHRMGHVGPRWARQYKGAWDGGHAMAEEVKCSAIRFREGFGNVGVIINDASDVRVKPGHQGPLPGITVLKGDLIRLAHDWGGREPVPAQ
eukprot:EG_transcript_59267